MRGSFRPDGWMNGVRMTRDGDTWRATVSVSGGASVQYKFLVNNSLWVNDPANPKPAARA